MDRGKSHSQRQQNNTKPKHIASLAPIEFVFILVVLLLPLVALADIVRRRFQDSINKVVWVLIVILVPALGTLLYFVLGTRQKVKA
ncbi:hypothetical protein DRJ53_11445 [Paracnuella aquatica]|nr:hypothetical protein DRJ53_11445 [Paracnuella aquatica]